MVALCAGAYAWHLHNNPQETRDGQETRDEQKKRDEQKIRDEQKNSPFYQEYTRLCQEIEALSTTDGSPYATIHKAGIDLPEPFSPTALPTGTLSKNTINKLAFIKLVLNDPDTIREYTQGTLHEVGQNIARLTWPLSHGKSAGRSIGSDALEPKK